jgi:thiamine-phosphate pyrophosphorylase
MPPGASGLAERLRLIVITDRRLARPRSITEVVRAAVTAGAPAIQLRDKEASARELAEAGRALLEITRPAGALLFVNDRLDVALAIGADGVHVGPDDIPVTGVRHAVRDTEARGVVTSGFLVGTSTDEPEAARTLVAAGADYIGCGTVYPTSSKPNAGEVIGLEGLQAVVEAVDVPVIGIGGVTVAGAEAIRAGTSAAGVAVIGAVMGAEDVAEVVGGLLAPWSKRP